MSLLPLVVILMMLAGPHVPGDDDRGAFERHHAERFTQNVKPRKPGAHRRATGKNSVRRQKSKRGRMVKVQPVERKGWATCKHRDYACPETE
jgi:hypothetical protein